jgi:urease accessory protein
LNAAALSEPDAPGAALVGHLHMEADADSSGRTFLARQSFRAPFHISKPYWDGSVLQVRVINPTAGILSGDRLDLAVRARAGSRLLVIVPAASRAFMMSRGTAECRQLFAVEDGASLEYAAEPLFPHEGSDYAQVTRLQVAAGGELCYADSLAPGRVGRGETWAWRRLLLGLELELGGRRVLRERFEGSGDTLRRMAAAYAMPEAWFGTVVAVSPRLTSASPAWDRIRALNGGGRRVGVTCVERGCWVVRVVVPGGLELRESMTAVRSLLSGELPGLASDLRRV